MFYFDVDRFKHINDSLGHSIGDRLLQSIAQRLVACARASDTVSRQGGDEFVVLFSEVLQAQDAATCAEKILLSVGGRNNFQFYRAELNTRAQRRVQATRAQSAGARVALACAS